MYIKGKRWFSLSLLLLFLLFAGTAEASTNLNQKKEELQNVKIEIQEKRTRLRTYKAQEKTVAHEITRLNSYMKAKEIQLQDLERQMVKNQQRVDAVKAEMDKIQEDLDHQIVILNSRLRDTYKNGTVSYLELLFGSEDFSDFLSRLQYMSFIIKQDLALIDKIEKEKAVVEQKKLELEKKQRAIAEIKAEVHIKKQELASNREQRKAALDRIQKEKAAYEKELNDLEQTSNALIGMIQRIQASSGYKPKNGSAVRNGSGSMMWPLNGTITSNFGYRVHPIFKTRKLHTGYDIAARHGTPIAAAKDGRVIFSGWMGGYGKAIIIDHGGGISTLYGHCSALLVGQGRDVDRGQTIAQVGSTGYSTGPHCHFEVRLNGTPVNPGNYL